jgi:protein-tyrosine phosphatase
MNSLDISKITDYLYISAFPFGRHAEEIASNNVRLILSMHWFPLDYQLNHPPLKVLWLPTLDNRRVKMPISFLKRGVQAALPVIDSGHAVLSHCAAGKHRSVAMACCVLIAKGFSADEAMQCVKAGRSVADPEIAHIQDRIRRFATYYK